VCQGHGLLFEAFADASLSSIDGRTNTDFRIVAHDSDSVVYKLWVLGFKGIPYYIAANITRFFESSKYNYIFSQKRPRICSPRPEKTETNEKLTAYRLYY